jgi:hypothetical protein
VRSDRVLDGTSDELGERNELVIRMDPIEGGEIDSPLLRADRRPR